ncbi:MAG: RNA polymerase factor sigma-54, partial [Telluria sp.]
MKPTLQLKLSQHLTLTPQLQQSIRLLQLSTLELNAEVERMLQENPLLEKDGEDEEGAAPESPASTTTGTASAEPTETVRVSDGEDDRADEPYDTAEAAERGGRAAAVDFAEEGGGAAGDGDWGS